ncbi:MAG: hypothetical protein KGI91_09505 [Burkholderiales bacterium]|nr:hypothetical protein [Burkholderiales bacterium]MDE2077294.1 hypothetical protein [Burkholderiales bacterium]MDE2431852.1 hypothetical protein [Burkholderiales bacterium]HET8869416.1 hypothetical protein [Aquabacterium sp.]
MSASFQLNRPTKSASIAVGLLMGMIAGTFVAPAAAASKSKADIQAPASDEQKAAAERVLYGPYQCEMGRSISVSRDTENPGYVKLAYAKQHWTMKPVLSSTGAVRLEDVKKVALLIQILDKSMVMDQKSGHRIVDGCVSAAQREAVEAEKTHPTASMFSDIPAQQ